MAVVRGGESVYKLTFLSFYFEFLFLKYVFHVHVYMTDFKIFLIMS